MPAIIDPATHTAVQVPPGMICREASETLTAHRSRNPAREENFMMFSYVLGQSVLYKIDRRACLSFEMIGILGG